MSRSPAQIPSDPSRSRLFAAALPPTLLILALAGNEAPAQTPLPLPDHDGLVMFIRNTLTAVNHGNLTGNYTVLRDLASQSFRNRHTAADLARTFAELRRQKIDLSPILVTEPRLTRSPARDRSGRLLVTGYVPTHPKAVKFALIFQAVRGGWSIDEIGLAVVPLEHGDEDPSRAPLSSVSPTPDRRTRSQVTP